MTNTTFFHWFGFIPFSFKFISPSLLLIFDLHCDATHVGIWELRNYGPHHKSKNRYSKFHTPSTPRKLQWNLIVEDSTISMQTFATSLSCCSYYFWWSFPFISSFFCLSNNNIWLNQQCLHLHDKSRGCQLSKMSCKHSQETAPE